MAAFPPIPRSRWLLGIGVLTWLLVGVPTLALNWPPHPAWLVGFLSFGPALAAATSLRGLALRWRLPWIALQSVGPALMGLTLGNGFEGLLLVVVALQLGRLVSTVVGTAWITAHTLLLAGAMWFHWAPAAAALLSIPYFGLQLIVLFLMNALRREEASRARLAAANAQLEAAQALLEQSARDAERNRIARELHDAMGHHLVALRLNLEILSNLDQDGDREAPLEAARSLVKMLHDDLQDLVHSDLDQPADLSRALRALADGMPRPTVTINPDVPLIDDANVAHTLLRCCQEIVTNAAKHAEAEILSLSLSQRNGELILAARDDGRGARAFEPGEGLRGIQARVSGVGGSVAFRTAPGRGFSVEVRIPAGRP